MKPTSENKLSEKTIQYLEAFKAKLLFPQALGYRKEVEDIWSYDELILLLLLGFSEKKAENYVDVNVTAFQNMSMCSKEYQEYKKNYIDKLWNK